MGVVYGALKILALLVGFVLASVSLMSLMGMFTANLLIQLGVSLVILVVLPLVLANFMLPDADDEEAKAKTKGLISDVFAMVWMVIGVFYLGLGGGSVTHAALAKEAKLLAHTSQPAGEALVWAIGDGPNGASVDTKSDGKKEKDDKAVAGKTDMGDKSKADMSPDMAKKAAKKTEKSSGPLVKMTPAQIFKKCSPSVVAIKIELANGRKGGGTGFFIDDNVLATNHHVVGNASKLKIKFVDGTVATEDIWILDQDEKKDLALVQVKVPESQKFKRCDFGDSDKIEIGANVITIGNPLGLEHTLSNGIISQRRILRGRKLIQFTAPISPGNSGGPLIDEYGRVLGINTLKVTGGMFGRGENLNLAVPINELKALIKDDYPNKRRVGEAKSGERTTW